MSQWTKIETRPGHPSQRGKLDPMPQGPYIKLSQFKRIDEYPWEILTQQCVLHQSEPQLLLGEVLYYNNNGRAEKCAYYIDSSD